MIVDDVWTTLGSANLNNRGMRDDTELNVATLDAELAHGLRMLLWAEHLELIGEESMLTVARRLGHQRQRRSLDERAAETLHSLQVTLEDPLAGLHLMIERAQDNLRRFHAKQPLVGHLLPYVTGGEAKQQGWRFHEEHGWVEAP
jgi:phosphatidylserine/phosphatidylglycerophosphate/cardiolipin synthase-like enzyme